MTDQRDDLEDARALEKSIERLDAMILDDQVRLENVHREIGKLSRLEIEIGRRIDERKQARIRIAENCLALYRRYATRRSPK